MGTWSKVEALNTIGVVNGSALEEEKVWGGGRSKGICGALEQGEAEERVVGKEAFCSAAGGSGKGGAVCFGEAPSSLWWSREAPGKLKEGYLSGSWMYWGIGEEMNNGIGLGSGLYGGHRAVMTESEYIYRHHKHQPRDNQCSSALVKHIKAPVHLVWSLVRRFDQPQKYKPFISRCVVQGEPEIGSVREINVKSGLPATTSTERLELLDDDEHILSMKIVGGDHRLRNYSSIITLHPEVVEGRPGTMVVESFLVDVPDGNTKEETCFFVEALIKCNLKSLADVSERLALQDRTEPLDRR